MSPKQETKQKPVSMPVLIAAGLGLIALAVVYLQPTQPAPPPPKQLTTGQINNTKGQPSNEKEVAASDGITDSNPAMDLIIDGTRDPFLPSSLVAKSKPGFSGSKPVSQSLPSTPIIQPIIPKIDEVDKVDPVLPVKNGTQIAWKGTLTAKNDQVIIIKVENKSYPLRLGDKVPGTEYLVAEVGRESILLISPKDQKRLTKKKEEK